MERLKAQVQVEIVAATKLANVYGVFEESCMQCQQQQQIRVRHRQWSNAIKLTTTMTTTATATTTL